MNANTQKSTSKAQPSTRKNKAAKPMATSATRLTYTPEQAAEVLGVSASLIRKAVRRGDLPKLKLGRHILIPGKKFEAFVNGDPIKAAR